jgi:hypothetical protein
LWQEQRIGVPILERPDRLLLRISTHFYINDVERDRLAEAMPLLLRQGFGWAAVVRLLFASCHATNRYFSQPLSFRVWRRWEDGLRRTGPSLECTNGRVEDLPQAVILFCDPAPSLAGPLRLR